MPNPNGGLPYWYDIAADPDPARQAEAAGKDGLHALIIGTSDYQYLPAFGQPRPRDRVTLGLTKLNTPATGAFRFAQWLAGGKYWHPTVAVKTVRLLVKPSASELASIPGLNAVDPMYLHTDTATVWEELQDWQKDCRDDKNGIAVLYAAGHGIQNGSPDDALVLLEDFSRDQNFLNQTLDVGRNLKAMKGDDMPQTQFYFADACSVEPDELADYEDAGKGLSLRISHGGSDLRAAPLFYAACPGTTAKGRPSSGKGTFFSEALIDCLNGEEPYCPPMKVPETPLDGLYRVTVSTLLDNLKIRVKKIEQSQEVRTGGSSRPGVFSAVEKNLVKVILHVNPEERARLTKAELLTWNSLPKITPARDCVPVPVELGDVEAGTYQIRLLTGSSNQVYAITAVPPRWADPIVLP